MKNQTQALFTRAHVLILLKQKVGHSRPSSGVSLHPTRLIYPLRAYASFIARNGHQSDCLVLTIDVYICIGISKILLKSWEASSMATYSMELFGKMNWMAKQWLLLTWDLHAYTKQSQAVVVVQLVEQSLPIPEVRGSNPVIGKKNLYIEHLFLSTVYWKDENKEKRGQVWPIF